MEVEVQRAKRHRGMVACSMRHGGMRIINGKALKRQAREEGDQ